MYSEGNIIWPGVPEWEAHRERKAESFRSVAPLLFRWPDELSLRVAELEARAPTLEGRAQVLADDATVELAVVYAMNAVRAYQLREDD